MTELYQDQIIDLLRQHVEAGCDAVLDETPVNHYAAAPSAPAANAAPPESTTATAPAMQEAMREAPQAALSTPHPAASVPPVAPAVAQPALGETNNAAAAATAADLAKAAQDLPALQAAMQGFDGCPLKKTAKNTVFSDGVADAKIMPTSGLSVETFAPSLITSAMAGLMGPLSICPWDDQCCPALRVKLTVPAPGL